MNYQVVDNKDAKRFEIHIDGAIAFEDYEYFQDESGASGIAYLHTEVPEALQGRGIASYLIKYILDYAAEHHLRVKPVCPLVKAYIDKHPEYQANSVFHQGA